MVYHQKQESEVVIRKINYLYQVMAEQKIPNRNLKGIQKIFHETNNHDIAMGFT